MLTYKHPKAKTCEVCERVFVPDRMGQLVCRPACAMARVRRVEINDVGRLRFVREP